MSRRTGFSVEKLLPKDAPAARFPEKRRCARRSAQTANFRTLYPAPTAHHEPAERDSSDSARLKRVQSKICKIIGREASPMKLSSPPVKIHRPYYRTIGYDTVDVLRHMEDVVRKAQSKRMSEVSEVELQQDEAEAAQCSTSLQHYDERVNAIVHGIKKLRSEHPPGWMKKVDELEQLLVMIEQQRFNIARRNINKSKEKEGNNAARQRTGKKQGTKNRRVEERNMDTSSEEDQSETLADSAIKQLSRAEKQIRNLQQRATFTQTSQDSRTDLNMSTKTDESQSAPPDPYSLQNVPRNRKVIQYPTVNPLGSPQETNDYLYIGTAKSRFDPVRETKHLISYLTVLPLRIDDPVNIYKNASCSIVGHQLGSALSINEASEQYPVQSKSSAADFLLNQTSLIQNTHDDLDESEFGDMMNTDEHLIGGSDNELQAHECGVQSSNPRNFTENELLIEDMPGPFEACTSPLLEMDDIHLGLQQSPQFLDEMDAFNSQVAVIASPKISSQDSIFNYTRTNVSDRTILNTQFSTVSPPFDSSNKFNCDDPFGWLQ